MGSLMAGWDSPVLNSRGGDRLARSSSFTKDEIQSFWKARRLQEQEHMRAAANVAAAALKPLQVHSQSSNSDKVLSAEDEVEKLNNYSDWWTKSSWAFLNDHAIKRLERPLLSKYQAQFHVAGAPVGSSNS